MRIRALLLVALVVIAAVCLVPQRVSACQFDTDCNPGSQCLKVQGAIYGVCAGGLNPGNRSDREPVYSPLDPNRTYGNTCQFNTDCGPGSACLKSSGSIYGVCVRGR